MTCTKEPITTIWVGGAFQSARPTSFNQRITNAGITLVERLPEQGAGIEKQAHHLLETIEKVRKPVWLIGHSLGALVAYRAHQRASKKVIPGTVLMNCGTIGERMPFQTGVTMNPFDMIFEWMNALQNPESLQALCEATRGDVEIGGRTDGLIMLAGASDPIIPRSFSERTAERIGVELHTLAGGHHLLDDDKEGTLLKVLMNWFKTGKGLRDLPCIAT